MATEKCLKDANALIAEFEWLQSQVSSTTALEIQEHIQRIKDAPTVDAVEVEKYKAVVEMYHELRENFIDYVCSGTCNVAPYCLNRCEGCVDRVGWCSQGSDECHGFNPAEVILDGAKMDGEEV